jgi:hypothetical protein
MPRCVKRSCRRNAPLERRRRALERLPEHGDDDLSALEGIQSVAHPLGATERVVLEPALDEARRGAHVVVGAEGDDEEVRLVRAGIGGDPPGRGVDAGDGLTPELDAVLGDVLVGQAHSVRRLPAEHDLQLGEAEEERITAVDQRDADGVGVALRKSCGELETAESGAQDEDVFLHRANGTERSGCA